MVLILSPKSRSSQGQGHLEVKVIPESNCKCLDFYPKASGAASTERILATAHLCGKVTLSVCLFLCV